MERGPQLSFEKPTEDYLRVATVSPEVSIADVPANVASLTLAYNEARNQGAELVVTPELSLTGYSTADLFPNRHVLEQTRHGLERIAKITEDGPALAVGAPIEHKGLLYNCAVILGNGEIKGIVPKSFLPNYKEFYEARWFTSGENVRNKAIKIGGNEVPFGTDLLFDVNGTTVAAEICEDLFAPISPASHSALAGAEVVINLSASNELIGKAEWRKTIISAFSGKLACAYVYASAGKGESVADVIYGGHQMVYESGRLLAETPPLSDTDKPLVFDIDREYLSYDRLINKTFAAQAQAEQQSSDWRTINISVPRPSDDRLLRKVDRTPFVPKNPETLNKRCEEIFAYLSAALAQRIKDADSGALTLGLSGGLDSTLALLTAIEATKRAGKPINFIHTVTMPGPASSEQTQDNASLLANALGTDHKVIPIGEMARNMLLSFGHDGITEDIAYENTQARIRKTETMNYANSVKGFDLGTGDMSENALGWCTFNGDHMSMFNPNTAVPKTLVKHLVSWYAETKAAPEVRDVLRDIVNTPISPELTGNGDLSQTTEDIVGPYELTDFFMYDHLRYGSRPNKIGYLASLAYTERTKEDIQHWLGSFMSRHTSSQWKRDVAPNGTKLGSISQSPRGDLRMAPNTSPDWWK